MTTDERLVLYAAGRLSDSDADEVRRQIAEDPELEAELECIRHLSGLGSSPLIQRKSWWQQAAEYQARMRRWVQRRPMAAAILGLALVSGVSVAGWQFLPQRALLSDDFDDDWFDWRIWEAPRDGGSKRGIKEEHGSLTLINRGYLISKAEFDPPYELSFDWSWKNKGLNPVYVDHLAVVLRTTAIENPKRANEVDDGIVMKFNPWTGQINSSVPTVATPEDSPYFRTTEPGRIKMLADHWYHIRIRDYGDRLQVFFSERGVQSESDDVPVLEAPCPTETIQRHFAIYNRELLANTPHESFIDNVVVRRLH